MTRPGGWIAVTQRRVRFAERGEEGDYLDARWMPLLAGHRVALVPNDVGAARALLAGLPLTAIVLSGGNDLPSAPGATDHAPTRDAVEDWLLHHAEQHGTTVIGICRGAQAIAMRAGARLTDDAPRHAGTRHQVTAVRATAWSWPAAFTVTSHHRHVLPTGSWPAVLPVIAVADGGDTVEAFTHACLPWWGLMWHPEREQPPGPATRALSHLLTHAPQSV
ncbi:gamma-glutamyl-gamma-aminobutyrate hydrolase family protein [Streptomyces sp. NBC_01571]|uniref:gamma-glutamyl-gamma-aminobutyrate hydrolase family protein n=1 Tax=Streptomyces sp. NBC_01571 TaxID=2975883 RepID=UPI00224D2B53|nr:gamma-glutamyl-gamma-aminobutyrate hydrolase family protein [Streptomyces sp. NBC_01571]MCX4581283.1 gamma-glutamyl-gamma-aminobutyrate hydrolase family protein [Streptomyces sp. NBC_01571]